ncbi:MAG: pre-toxin TG domain-containing protein [Cellulosilyticaceae bacterium]
MDLIAGKDIITGEKMNRWILAGMIVTPEIVDKAIKSGAKNGDEILEFIKKTTGAGKNDAVKETSGKVVTGVSNATKYSIIDEGLNFSGKALEHMGESARQVPVQTLQNAIRYGEELPDPRGSSATMYYITMNINEKLYNLEVLYDKATNTVYHFEYARKAMGNLPAIKK